MTFGIFLRCRRRHNSGRSKMAY